MQVYGISIVGISIYISFISNRCAGSMAQQQSPPRRQVLSHKKQWQIPMRSWRAQFCSPHAHRSPLLFSFPPTCYLIALTN